MPSYILKPTGAIRHNRRNVGRVVRATSGLWAAEIGQHRAVNADKSTAFREVVALACGFTSLLAMRQRNAQVRASNREQRARRAALMPALSRDWASRATATLSPEAMIEALQQGAIDAGETPLTADQIRATWRV